MQVINQETTFTGVQLHNCCPWLIRSKTLLKYASLMQESLGNEESVSWLWQIHTWHNYSTLTNNFGIKAASQTILAQHFPTVRNELIGLISVAVRRTTLFFFPYGVHMLFVKLDWILSCKLTVFSSICLKKQRELIIYLFIFILSYPLAGASHMDQFIMFWI